MKRRNFLTLTAGASALSMINPSAVFAANETTPFYLRGLAMLALNDPQYLRIALPEAPHHSASIKIVLSDGKSIEKHLHGHGALEGLTQSGPRPDIRLPELVSAREIYRDAFPKLDKSPSVISIPWSAVNSVSTESVSEDRWTFVWQDTGEEVATFRPRRLAETLRIDLASTGSLRLNDGELAIPLSEAQEVSTEFTPMSDDAGDYTEHFAHYLPYIETVTDARMAIPRRLGASTRRTTLPALGNSFARVTRVWPYRICFPFLVD